ncbi:MAG: tetratricopeptide repeat protein, partial [Candidatus Methylomirabilales bacterium]
RKQGRLEEAIQLCQDGLTDCPNYASAYMVLGRARQEKGDLVGARDAFQWVLQIDPESVQALKFLGQIAEARNETPDALASYRMALIFHPFDKEVRATAARLEQESAVEVESAPAEVAELSTEPVPMETAMESPSAEPEVSAEPHELAAELFATDTAVESISPEGGDVSAEPATADLDLLATETMAELYAAQGLYDRAADIYGRLVSESPDREDLAEKYQQARAHLEERAGRHSSSDADVALHLLETWRDVFRQLRRREKVAVAPFEGRRDTLRQPRHGEKASVELLEAWRNAFRRLRPRPKEPVQLLESWREAFRRLKTAKGEGTG